MRGRVEGKEDEVEDVMVRRRESHTILNSDSSRPCSNRDSNFA